MRIRQHPTPRSCHGRAKKTGRGLGNASLVMGFLQDELRWMGVQLKSIIGRKPLSSSLTIPQVYSLILLKFFAKTPSEWPLFAPSMKTTIFYPPTFSGKLSSTSGTCTDEEEIFGVRICLRSKVMTRVSNSQSRRRPTTGIFRARGQGLPGEVLQ